MIFHNFIPLNFKKIHTFFQIFNEGLRFTWQSIISNKLRTFLSLLGITIGIISIISVFTIVDSLEKNIKQRIDSLGDNVIYVGKWPWGSSGEYEWWRFFNRPEPDFNEFRILKTRSNLSKEIAFSFDRSTYIKKNNTTLEEVVTKGITYDYAKILNLNFDLGRYFTQNDIMQGKNYAIIGYNLYQALFDGIDPIGSEIKVGDTYVKVIGVLEKEGESIVGESQDNIVLLPYFYAKRFLKVEGSDPAIMITPIDGISNAELKGEIKNIIRSIRRIRPISEDNFALNEASIIAQGLEKLFRIINISGWIIGGFSILVGGFGIANIMFVSVKERTKIIGIQKALGAENFFILLQFLLESIFLCIVGGILGIAIVWILSIIASNLVELDLYLGLNNIILGLFISVIIGILSGFFPAYTASKMDPVDAIRQ